MTVDELVKSDLYRNLFEKYINARNKVLSCVTVKEFTDCFTDILDFLHFYEKYDFFKGNVVLDCSESFKREINFYEKMLKFINDNYSDSNFKLKYDDRFKEERSRVEDEWKAKH